MVVVLQSQLLLGVLVGEQAGFAQQGCVLQLPARQLLVNRLQTKQEHPMTKPTAVNVGQYHKEEGTANPGDPASQRYRGDGASAIHTRSTLQASTGS